METVHHKDEVPDMLNIKILSNKNLSAEKAERFLFNSIQ